MSDDNVLPDDVGCYGVLKDGGLDHERLERLKAIGSCYRLPGQDNIVVVDRVSYKAVIAALTEQAVRWGYALPWCLRRYATVIYSPLWDKCVELPGRVRGQRLIHEMEIYAYVFLAEALGITVFTFCFDPGKAPMVLEPIQ